MLGDEFEALRGEISEEELDTFLNQRNFEKDLGRRKLLAKALRSDWLKGKLSYCVLLCAKICCVKNLFDSCEILLAENCFSR